MANITVLEALQLSLNATKKYVDDKIAETSSGGGEELPVVTSSATTFDVARTDINNAITTMPALIYFDPTNDIRYTTDNTIIHVKGLCHIYIDPDGMTNYVFLNSNIAIKFDSDNYSYVRTLYTPKANILSKYNTLEYTPTTDYNPATKKYVDDEVAKVNASGGYIHPDSHPASMITGLATVATSGDYNDLNNKPITILTAAENEFIILSELAAGAYLITGLVKYMSTDTAPESFDSSFVEVTKFDSLTIVADPSYITVIDSINNSMESSPRINVQADWNAVDTKDPSYINNKPTIPTVTNDLTNALKANYDAAYTHSTSAHAPVNAQKNSDITKAEIEAKLTGNITSHTHSQYLTSIPSEYITEQELTSKGYATESQINSAIEAAATTHEEVKTTVNQILGGAYIE